MSITNILKESISSFKEDGCLNLSVAIAFYAILLLIPFLYLLVLLVSLFVGSEGEILPRISSYIRHLISFISKPVLYEVGQIFNLVIDAFLRLNNYFGITVVPLF